MILAGVIEGVQPTTQEVAMARELRALRKILDGVPQEAIDGGWTARGLSDYAKQLETELAAMRERAEPACVTAEHRRVIQLLLNVCGAAFELADDSCQQLVDGEECHVVPDDSFQKLSVALDEIENTLPDEYEDTILQWGAIPRHALCGLLVEQPAAPAPVRVNQIAEQDRIASDIAGAYMQGCRDTEARLAKALPAPADGDKENGK
nr:hypothetical protein [Cronobacter sakazakii]